MPCQFKINLRKECQQELVSWSKTENGLRRVEGRCVWHRAPDCAGGRVGPWSPSLPAWKTARLLLVCLHNHRAAPRSGREPPPRDHRQGRGVYSFREGETRPYDHTRGPRACRASQSHPFCPVGPSRGQGQRGELADFRWS